MADYEVKQRETVVHRDPVVDETVVTREPVVQERREIVEDPSAPGRILVARIAGLIWLLFAALDALILVRILLKFIAANPTSDFARAIYVVSGVFLAPFSGLIASPAIGNGVIEISSMIAIVVYSLLAWLIVRLFRLIFTPAHTGHSVTTYHREL